MRRPVWVFRKGRCCIDDFFALDQIIKERHFGLVGMGKACNRQALGRFG